MLVTGIYKTTKKYYNKIIVTYTCTTALLQII